MPRPKKPREYRFEIDAFTPETIPLSRLSQYLADVARMMGQETNVHLARIDKGSTVPVIWVDWEAEPKVRERLREVNANGWLLDPSASKVIRFPGRDGANQPEFGPITQQGIFQGTPIKIGGENDPVPVHLEDGESKHIVLAPRRIAKEIAPYLFTSAIRVEGTGRWQRDRMGEWEMLVFHVNAFQVLKDGDLKTGIGTLRAIPGAWKQADDPLGDLMAIRTGERPQ